MSTHPLGTHLSLSPMSAQPSKKGRDHDGHAPQHQLCTARPLRKLCADDLCCCRLVEVAAGGLAECAHNLAHLLLGRGAQVGDDLLDQSLELLTRNLRGQQALQNLDLLGQVVGTLLVGAGLD